MIFYAVVLLLLAIEPSFAQQFRWARSLAEPNKSSVTATSVDTVGNIYTLGYSQRDNERLFGLHASGNIFLIKHNTNGELLWQKHFTGVACGYDMTVDRTNNIIIVGTFRDSLVIGNSTLRAKDFYASFIAMFNSDGDLLWLTKDTSQANSANFSVTTDKQNAVYLTGIDYDIEGYFAKYDATGKKLWKKYVKNVRTFDDIVVDENGNIYVAGTCTPEAMFDQIAIPDSVKTAGYVIFIAQYDSDLKAKWIHTDRYITFTIANQLALTSWGNVARFRETASINNTRSLELFSPTGDQGVAPRFTQEFADHDQFIMNTLTATAPHGVYISMVDRDTLSIIELQLRITPDTIQYGTRKLASIYGKDLVAQGISCDATSVFLGGSFTDPQLVFGDLSITNSNNVSAFENDLFLTKFNTDGSVAAVKEKYKNSAALSLYPNPCKDVLSISSSNSTLQNSEVVIRDILGNVVKRVVNTESSSLSVTDIPAGVYMISVTTAEETLTGRFVKE